MDLHNYAEVAMNYENYLKASETIMTALKNSTYPLLRSMENIE